ncbi:MAG: type II secretion system F family protein [Gammaproteobacteria bacterium]|jgi:type IV pilus assembly protein PilC
MNTPKTLTYTWRGIDTNHNKICGEITAVNFRLAKAKLQSQKISILKLKRKSQLSWLTRYRNRITSVNITLILRQLNALLIAGIPILQALATIAKSCNNINLRNLLTDINDKIQHGHALSEALRSYNKYFSNLACALVFAGEQSGTLDILLECIIIHREKMEILKGKIKKTLFYPCAVIIIAAMVAYILLVFVVPQFADLFSGFGVQLPFLTRLVINLSNLLQRFWWILVLSLILPWIAIIILKRRSISFANFFDAMMLKIPIFGNFLRKSIIARLMRTLATTFAAGMPLLESLCLLRDVANNQRFRVVLGEIYNAVSKGQTLYQSLQISGLFPNIVVQMVAIGEEAGKLPDMLEKAANFYEYEVNQLVDKLNQLLEPVIMIILGIVVGGLVIAMYLPIFNLGMVI